MEEMVDVLDSLSKAILKNVKEVSKITDLNKRKIQAETVKLLCESMGVFLNLMNLSDPDLMNGDDEDDIPF
jgi:hypothetical protein